MESSKANDCISEYRCEPSDFNRAASSRRRFDFDLFSHGGGRSGLLRRFPPHFPPKSDGLFGAVGQLFNRCARDQNRRQFGDVSAITVPVAFDQQ